MQPGCGCDLLVYTVCANPGAEIIVLLLHKVIIHTSLTFTETEWENLVHCSVTSVFKGYNIEHPSSLFRQRRNTHSWTGNKWKKPRIASTCPYILLQIEKCFKQCWSSPKCKVKLPAVSFFPEKYRHSSELLMQFKAVLLIKMTNCTFCLFLFLLIDAYVLIAKDSFTNIFLGPFACIDHIE